MRDRRKNTWLLIVLLVGTVMTARFFFGRQPADGSGTELLTAPAIDTSGFARAEGPAEIRFPDDNGPHPEYLTEWWYYTGNLETAEGRHFGFQLTFFRRALAPQALITSDRSSDWAADQVYLAHFSFTDVEEDNFLAFERFSRGAAELAGAQADPYRVWLENWSVEAQEDGSYLLKAANGDLSIDLDLVDLKGPILHGDGGYSRKGPEPGNASYYISQTRLEADGSIRIGDQHFNVSGLAWMDHEYSTSALAADQVGWDWFSIQLEDGTDLMLFQLRREDGSAAEYSSGTVIYEDGSILSLASGDFTLTAGATWTSPASGAAYPAVWTITIPSEEIFLTITPYSSDQELAVSFTYWEGAVRVDGSRAGQPVGGSGYLEMTGYAHSMQGEF